MTVFNIVVFFFFKQKTAYEMLRSLVGSEMCIRDRTKPSQHTFIYSLIYPFPHTTQLSNTFFPHFINSCLLYTSDAADERSSVDLGGRRIIKKKKNIFCYLV